MSSEKLPPVNAECLCAKSGAPWDAFDGIYHWRWDCPYLKEEERRACLMLYAEEATSLGIHVGAAPEVPRG